MIQSPIGTRYGGDMPDKQVGWTAGQKHDEGKAPWDLLAFDAIAGTVEVLKFGASKYAPRNWENGIAYSRCYSALMRHMTSFWMGEDADPETGLPHLDHAACCIMFLQAFNNRKMGQLDDRPHNRAD